MPSGSLMVSVRITYPFGMSALLDRLFRAARDGLAGGILQFRWHVGDYRFRVTVVGQSEDFRAQRQAHAVPTADSVVYPDLHAGVNSRWSSVRPRRIYVGTYW